MGIKTRYLKIKKDIARSITLFNLYYNILKDNKRITKIFKVACIVSILLAISLISIFSYQLLLKRIQNISTLNSSDNYTSFEIKNILCGDNFIDNGEQCEKPDSKNNSYCKQSSQECFLRKSGIRDSFGDCSLNCSCLYNEFDLRCIKGTCRAECNQDGSGCQIGETCFTASCVCVNACGDGMLNFGENCSSCPIDCPVPVCPAKVEAKWDKYSYYPGDNGNLTVRIYDKEGNLMPYVGFFIDTYIDNNFVSTGHQVIPATKTFVLKGTFKNLELSGRGTYVIRTDVSGCNEVTTTTNANFERLEQN